ncbi:ribosomal RNA small subunit methyltransferase A [Patescibacteria group bacterium]|nr:ribosomal RNA small subunit methyltransferase A [Patescibacteria group bacterium]
MKLSEIKELLEKYKLSPTKSLGQNFLMDENILDKIVESAEVNVKDYVIEVGPGLGVLTRKLSERARKVTAIELDNGLIPLLQNELSDCKNLKIIHMDALKFTPPDEPYKVVANIPYYITSPLISHFLRAKSRPSKMVLLMQKEVAEKICAKKNQLNVLAIHVQVFGEPKIAARVSKGCFYPKPKIESAILEIEMFEQPLVKNTLKDLDHFFKIVHAGFSHKRKTLLNSIQRGMVIDSSEVKAALLAAKIDPSERAQHLTIEDWGKLAKNIFKG